jgi:hypothetical protein
MGRDDVEGAPPMQMRQPWDCDDKNSRADVCDPYDVFRQTYRLNIPGLLIASVVIMRGVDDRDRYTIKLTRDDESRALKSKGITAPIARNQKFFSRQDIFLYGRVLCVLFPVISTCYFAAPRCGVMASRCNRDRHKVEARCRHSTTHRTCQCSNYNPSHSRTPCHR